MRGHQATGRQRDPVARIAGDLAKVADAFFYETATPLLAKEVRGNDPNLISRDRNGALIENDATAEWHRD